MPTEPNPNPPELGSLEDIAKLLLDTNRQRAPIARDQSMIAPWALDEAWSGFQTVALVHDLRSGELSLLLVPAEVNQS